MSEDVDALFSEYGDTLPDDFKQHFPSLRHIYEKLSNDIHSATASERVFLKSEKDIETHFDAKRL